MDNNYFFKDEKSSQRTTRDFSDGYRKGILHKRWRDLKSPKSTRAHIKGVVLPWCVKTRVPPEHMSHQTLTPISHFYPVSSLSLAEPHFISLFSLEGKYLFYLPWEAILRWTHEKHDFCSHEERVDTTRGHASKNAWPPVKQNKRKTPA
jgi:hypothetical protein